MSVYCFQGIIESDDLSLLSLEIEKAINFSKKCQMLVESVKKKDSLVIFLGISCITVVLCMAVNITCLNVYSF